jgi:hypothetical protein
MSGNIADACAEKLTIATLFVLVLGAVASLFGCAFLVATSIAELASYQLAHGLDYAKYGAAY